MERKPERLKWIKEMNEKPTQATRLKLGKYVQIDRTAKLGERGHSMEKDDDGNWVRAKHFGDIIIGDSVHIGEFVVIKRSTMPNTATIIGEDTKICAFTNISHNCKIGKHCFIAPHVLINGSAEIGDNVWISGHAVIRDNMKVGDGAVIGMGAVVTKDVPAGETVVGVPAMPLRFVGNYVDPSFKYGKNLKIGKFNHIYDGVEVGDNCTIRNHVELRRGTVVGDDCYIDSGVKSSGKCKIGNRVTLRYDDIIARGVEIADDVFISPQLMTENLNQYGEEVGGAKIGIGDWDGSTAYRVFIGTNVTLAAGISICPGTIIGSKANVRKSITELGIYVGNPSRRLK